MLQSYSVQRQQIKEVAQFFVKSQYNCQHAKNLTKCYHPRVDAQCISLLDSENKQQVSKFNRQEQEQQNSTFIQQTTRTGTLFQQASQIKIIHYVIKLLAVLNLLLLVYSTFRTTTTVIHKNRDKQLEFILARMMQRPVFDILSSKKQLPVIHYSDKGNLFLRFKVDPNNPLNREVEKYYYQKLYNISRYQIQLPFCVIASGRNLIEKQDKTTRFLDSVNRQNYMNYHLVITDDLSDDGTFQMLQQHLNMNFTKLKQKTTLIKNQKRSYALKNKYLMIYNNCRQGEIIIDIDADDQLIGVQFFKLFNSVYQNEQIWVAYFNNIRFSYDGIQIATGTSEKYDQEVFNQGLVRYNAFRISAPRSFRRQLFTKINKQYFIDPKTKQFWLYTYDSFLYRALLQLAGYKHTQFLNQYIYYYHFENKRTDLDKKFYSDLASRQMIPFKPIDKLQQTTVAQQYSQHLLSLQKREQLSVNLKYVYKKVQPKPINQVLPKYQNIVFNLLLNESMIKQTCMLLRQQQQDQIDQDTRQKVYLNYKITEQVYNQDFSNIQLYILDKQYSLFQSQCEQNFCIIITRENQNQFQNTEYYIMKIIASLARQKYDDFRAILHIQTQQMNTTIQYYLKYYYPQLINKILTIKDSTLNHISIIQRYCFNESIILPVKLQSEFIGRYALATINRLFMPQQIQMMYGRSMTKKKVVQKHSNYLNHQITLNGMKQIKRIQQNMLSLCSEPYIFGFRNSQYTISSMKQKCIYSSCMKQCMFYTVIQNIDQGIYLKEFLVVQNTE